MMSPFADLSATPRNHYSLLLHGALARLLALLGAGETSPGGVRSGGKAEGGDFLEGYRRTLAAPVPEPRDPAAVADWWTGSLAAWEEHHGARLPLTVLSRGGRLSLDLRIALVAPALAEEDARLADLFDRLQAPGGGQWPRVQLLGRLIEDGPAVTGVSDPWTLCRPLVEMGLLQVLDRDAPRARWSLRLPPLLLDALRGDLNGQPAPGLKLTRGDRLRPLSALVLPEAFRTELARSAALLASGGLSALVLRGGAGSAPGELAGALARSMGRALLRIAPAGLDGDTGACIGPLCDLVHALPLVENADQLAETTLDRIPGPRVLALGRDACLPGESGRGTLSLEIPELGPGLRRAIWAACLEGVEADTEAISSRFVLSAGHIPAVAGAALQAARAGGRNRVGTEALRKAVSDLNRRELLAYADHLEVRGGWGDLVTAEDTSEGLHELYRRCRYRERLTEALGPGFGNSTNRGVRALFTGVSGTGKTLAAKILAAELGLDLFRVDLAAVVNKYIGETEKNLREVLGRAESLDLILLLDEGDALLGGRTEVRSSNDRYANLQTNYLLQRLEHYQGIVLVTTNLVENIDRAFKRRMDLVVPFYPPEPAERNAILRLHLPPGHQVSGGFLHGAAARCALSGGQLRNAVLHAGLLALDEGSPVSDRHLHAALRNEYRKAGAAFPLTPDPPWEGSGDPGDGDPLEAFANALSLQRG